MAFSITEFKSNLKGGGARPSLFTVVLRYPSGVNTSTIPKSEFLVKGASIPTSTIGTYDVFFHGKAIHVAGDRTFETWDTTIINDEDYGIRIALEKWMDLVADHKLNTRSKTIITEPNSSDLTKGGKEGEGASYKQDIFVTQFGKDGKHKHHYHFLGAFPTTISAIPLDWGTASEIEEYTVTWTYDRWMPGGITPNPASPINHLFPGDEHK